MNGCIVTGKDLVEALAQCEDQRRMLKALCERQEQRIAKLIKEVARLQITNRRLKAKLRKEGL